MSGTFEGVRSLQFTPDNKYAYTYYFKSIDGELIRYAEFTTEGYYLVGHMVGGRNMKSGAECTIEAKMNGFTVFKTKWDNGTSGTNNNPLSSPTPFVIPPFTTVLVTADNISSGTNRNHTAHIKAKVKGAIEQIDLEAIRDGSKWADQ